MNKALGFEILKWVIASAIGLAAAGFSAAMYLNRYALAADQAELEQRVDEHDVMMGRFDEDLHWIMDRLDAPGAPPRPMHRGR